ncbi:hypothetical protein K488DRAFT_74266 [Vararia minispora EC-137]|uniref:Uncharacterized protein n=1 Tax=Vararia minispora EC-137 TaxID=1314806 RepID=A0ACB8Q7N2_9AGAM|nr:hypothetical protein K488DRAFT_74266 [Vararia minispora EC-137]
MSVPTARIEINRLMDFNGSARSAHDELLWCEQQLVSTLITTDTGPAAHTEPMDVEHAQDSIVDHLTSVTTPLGHLISVFWFVCGFIGFQVQIGSHIKKVLSRDMYVFGMVEELMGFSNALAVFTVRLDGIGSEWVQRKLFGMRHLLIVSTLYVAMVLDTMRHVHNPATFYDIVDAYIACKRRHSYLHNALWPQDLSPTACTTYYDRMMIWIDLPNHETYPYDVWRTNAQLVGPVGSVDMGMLMVQCNTQARDYGVLDDIPSVTRNVFNQESTAVIEVGTSEDDSGSDIPEDAGDGMLDEESILFIDEDALDIYHGIIPRPIPPTAPCIRCTPGDSTRA